MGSLNLITESVDFIEALYWALPNSKRPKKPQDMLKDIYDNYEDIDILKALQNLIVNEVGDRLIGKLAKGANKGYHTGPHGRLVGPAL